MAADSAASIIADPTIAVAGAALAIGTAFAGMRHSKSSFANCRSGDNLHAADITRIAASFSAGAECAPCYWTANSNSMAGSLRLFNRP